MNLESLQQIMATPAGKDLKDFLLEERDKMNKLPPKTTIFNFWGSLVELVACQKALEKIDELLTKLNIPKANIKDPKDRYD